MPSPGQKFCGRPCLITKSFKFYQFKLDLKLIKELVILLTC